MHRSRTGPQGPLRAAGRQGPDGQTCDSPFGVGLEDPKATDRQMRVRRHNDRVTDSRRGVPAPEASAAPMLGAHPSMATVNISFVNAMVIHVGVAAATPKPFSAAFGRSARYAYYPQRTSPRASSRSASPGPRPIKSQARRIGSKSGASLPLAGPSRYKPIGRSPNRDCQTATDRLPSTRATVARPQKSPAGRTQRLAPAGPAPQLPGHLPITSIQARCDSGAKKSPASALLCGPGAFLRNGRGDLI